MGKKEFINVLNNATIARWGDKTFNDSCFIIEKGAEKDKSGDILMKFKHLPHHNKTADDPMSNSTVDIPHLRNALARVNQIKPIKESKDAFIKRARTHLSHHAKALLKKYKEKGFLNNSEFSFVGFCDQVGIELEDE